MLQPIGMICLPLFLYFCHLRGLLGSKCDDLLISIVVVANLALAGSGDVWWVELSKREMMTTKDRGLSFGVNGH